MLKDKLLEDIEKLAEEEKEYANTIFPLFNSAHEGYAVLKEEIEEAEEEIKRMARDLQAAWGEIKKNETGEEYMGLIETEAKLAAAECIQVVAMCKKYRESLGGAE